MNAGVKLEQVVIGPHAMFPVMDAEGKAVAYTDSAEKAAVFTRLWSFSGKNRVVIRVKGGTVTGASADNPDVELIVVDDDNIAAGDSHPFGSERACNKILKQMHPIY